jgi:hypothetical protein
LTQRPPRFLARENSKGADRNHAIRALLFHSFSNLSRSIAA